MSILQDTKAQKNTNAEQRMRSILAKHCERIGVSPEIDKPPEQKRETTTQLVWEKPKSSAQNALQTSCGRYRCEKLPLDDLMLYGLYRLNPDQILICLGAEFRTFEQVKAAAQKDFERLNQ